MSIQDSLNTISAWFTRTSTGAKLVWMVAFGLTATALVFGLMWAFEP